VKHSLPSCLLITNKLWMQCLQLQPDKTTEITYQ